MIVFADDTKLWRIIKTTNDNQILQRDLDALMNWSNKYLLKFNPQKCKFMCIGQSGSAHREYYLQEKQVNTSYRKLMKKETLES